MPRVCARDQPYSSPWQIGLTRVLRRVQALRGFPVPQADALLAVVIEVPARVMPRARRSREERQGVQAG